MRDSIYKLIILLRVTYIFIGLSDIDSILENHFKKGTLRNIVFSLREIHGFNITIHKKKKHRRFKLGFIAKDIHYHP